MKNCVECGKECNPSYVRWKSTKGYNYVWSCPNKCQTKDAKLVWNGWVEENAPTDHDSSRDICATDVTDIYHPSFPKDDIPECYHQHLFSEN